MNSGVLEYSVDFQRKRLRRAPQRGEASTIDVGLIDAFAAEHRLVDITGIPPSESARPHSHGITDRHIDRSAEVISQSITMVNRAGARTHISAEIFSRRIHRNELEKAANAAGAIQSALRATQHFDTRQIAGIDVGRGIPSANGG